MADRSAQTAVSEDREVVLTLGNKQVLSVLFIVFVLMGVFFAMGYVMGRTAAPAETAARRDADPPVRNTPAAVAEPATKPVIDSAPVESTSIPVAAEPAATQPEASASASGAAPETPAEVAPIVVVEPEPGQTFLQVSAVAKPEAEILAELLQKKGFRTIIAPGPNDKLFRVLVGPTSEQASLIKTRSDLEQAGFKPMVRKY